jgi:hypothetical protein
MRTSSHLFACILTLALLPAAGAEPQQERDKDRPAPPKAEASRKVPDDEVELRIFDITDLVTEPFYGCSIPLDPTRVDLSNLVLLKGDEVVEGLRKLRPELWKRPGTTIEERSGKLVVMQTPAVHAAIEAYLAGMRQGFYKVDYVYLLQTKDNQLCQPWPPGLKVLLFQLDPGRYDAEKAGQKDAQGWFHGYPVRSERVLTNAEWEGFRPLLCRPDIFDNNAYPAFRPTYALRFDKSAFGDRFSTPPLEILVSAKEERLYFQRGDLCYKRGLTEKGAKDLEA